MVKILFSDNTGSKFVDYLQKLEKANDWVSLSKKFPANTFQFRESPIGGSANWHCTEVNTTQWVIVIQGKMKVGLRDGSSVTFEPGDMFLSMDTRAAETFQDHEGHTSASVGTTPLKTFFVTVPFAECQAILAESL